VISGYILKAKLCVVCKLAQSRSLSLQPMSMNVLLGNVNHDRLL